ncbi:MAG TPA: hypothetical protein VM933_11055 [Acidimicrobiales bacterium]|nr:hypothetical protein [Acidimicrobiales bacterium]
MTCDFVPLEGIEPVTDGRPWGTITFARSAPQTVRPSVLLVTARGPISPTMVRRDLEVARSFAAGQDEPWWYVVDPTDAIPHPANLRYLRAVRRLPGVAGYVVVARRRPMRLAASVLRRLGGPHHVVPSLDEALALISRR